MFWKVLFKCILRIKFSALKNSQKDSLRANFITELDNLDIDLSIIERLVGHSHQGLVRSAYSGGFRIEKLREVIEKLNYGSEINFLIKDNYPDFS